MNMSFMLNNSCVKKTLLLIPLLGLLNACGSDNDDIKADPNTKILYIDFNESVAGWKAGFADYPVGQEIFYELASGQEKLPAALGNNRKGYKLSGNNHSDDLYMFVTKKIDGLEPNTRYDFRFKLTFGTNAQKKLHGRGWCAG